MVKLILALLIINILLTIFIVAVILLTPVSQPTMPVELNSAATADCVNGYCS